MGLGRAGGGRVRRALRVRCAREGASQEGRGGVAWRGWGGVVYKFVCAVWGGLAGGRARGPHVGPLWYGRVGARGGGGGGVVNSVLHTLHTLHTFF